MNTTTAFFVLLTFDGGTTKFGPIATREEAEYEAQPFMGRPGWTVKIVEKTVPASDFFDGPF